MLNFYIFPMTYCSIIDHIMFDVMSYLFLSICCRYIWISNDILEGGEAIHAHLFWFYSYVIV